MQKIKAKKNLGQNFLIDEEALSDIANAIQVSDTHIVEVGPGYGALTEYIIRKNPKSLDLIELDRDMIEILRGRFGLIQNEGNDSKDQNPEILHLKSGITLHHIDILKYIPRQKEYSVIANIPYYITSPILFRFLYDLDTAPSEMVIMMQEEVGEKILKGRAQKPHHSFLSLSMETACSDIEIVRYVSRGSFDPVPDVDSIVLRFTIKKERKRDQEQQLMQLWKIAFTHPRKTFLSNMKGSQYRLETIRENLMKLGYDDRVRAEAIKREDWVQFL